jgi:hypothetical protein
VLTGEVVAPEPYTPKHARFRFRVHPEVPGIRNGHHLASALRVRAAVDTAISGDRSARLDLNQRPFGPQPNALLACRRCFYADFRIPMRFEVV